MHLLMGSMISKGVGVCFYFFCKIYKFKFDACFFFFFLRTVNFWWVEKMIFISSNSAVVFLGKKKQKLAGTDANNDEKNIYKSMTQQNGTS